MKPRKNPKSDLSKYYTVFLEIGLVVVLVIFIIAMKLDLSAGESNVDLTEEQEVVEMKEVVRTQQQKKPPPPPQPQVPVEVPNDEVIDDQDINLNSELDLDEPLPEPPKQQKQGDTKEEIFVAVEQEPEIVGGQKALYENLEYPASCKRANIQGRVILQFVVNTDGTVQDVQVIRGIGGGCDDAAIKAVQAVNFKPGRQRGKPVRVRFSLPILFQLR